MMSRDKLFQLRSRVKAGGVLDRNQLLALIDHGTQALIEMAGGQSAVEAREELRNREREVGRALAQIRSELTELRELHKDVVRTVYTTDAAIEMLSAKGPAWLRDWAFYQPRIEEEFE